MSKKTEKLGLLIEFDGTDKVKTWRDGMDENFKLLDNTFGILLEAIAKAEEEFSQIVDLEDNVTGGEA